MKVSIGSRWRRAWFETRDRYGTYEALNAPMCPDAVRLQDSLLDAGQDFDHGVSPWAWLLYGVALVLAVAAAAVVVG